MTEIAKKRSKVRICMIGAGSMANKVHYPSLASFDDVEIVGICDLNPTPLNETADKYNIPQEYRFEIRYPDEYRKMIEKQGPDGVYKPHRSE